MEETRAVCIREVQRSLAQSVKQNLEDEIQSLGLGRYFDVTREHIKAPYGGLIIFQGMQNHTAESIKSFEGFDVAYVEEAQSLSAYSMRILRPTIRKPKSEIWFAWNPNSPDDPVDQMFRGPNKITEEQGALVVECSWKTNPWLPDEAKHEMEIDLRLDPDNFDHVWNGQYITISDAIIFRGRVIVDNFETPSKVDRFFYGVDWGFARDPLAIVRCFIKDKKLFVDWEGGGTNIELNHTAMQFNMIPGMNKWPIKADNSRPESISYMVNQGFAISAAEKWQGSVEDGIAYMKAFDQIIVHRRCPNTAQEFRTYSYKVDKQTEEILPIVVDKNNHYIDAIRYSLDGYILKKGTLKVSDKLLLASAQRRRYM